MTTIDPDLQDTVHALHMELQQMGPSHWLAASISILALNLVLWEADRDILYVFDKTSMLADVKQVKDIVLRICPEISYLTNSWVHDVFDMVETLSAARAACRNGAPWSKTLPAVELDEMD